MKANKLKPFYNNKNIPGKLRKGKSLYIDDIFQSIQTEGPFAGCPAMFIRLYGCSLACNFCDTPQKNHTTMSVKEIMKRMKNHGTTDMVVITGGEPFLQNLEPLVTALHKEKFWVQYETSGSVPLKALDPYLQGTKIVVSPKTLKIDKSIAEAALCFKYVTSVDNTDPKDGLPKGLYRPAAGCLGTVMLSPMWTNDPETRYANIEHTVELCKKFGWFFTLQYHKLIGIK